MKYKKFKADRHFVKMWGGWLLDNFIHWPEITIKAYDGDRLSFKINFVEAEEIASEWCKNRFDERTGVLNLFFRKSEFEVILELFDDHKFMYAYMLNERYAGITTQNIWEVKSDKELTDLLEVPEMTEKAII